MKKEKIKLKQSNIALIGFMGVGKSAVGQVLAQKLGKKLVEVDGFIVNTTGKSIPQIFEEGEIAFRELEIAAVKEIAAGKNQVIACGGGVVLNRINVDRLKQDALVVWLTATPATVLKRTRRDGAGRPLLQPGSDLQYIRELLRFRRPFYERAADLQVDTSRAGVEAAADQIINKLKEYADNIKEK